MCDTSVTTLFCQENYYIHPWTEWEQCRSVIYMYTSYSSVLYSLDAYVLQLFSAIIQTSSRRDVIVTWDEAERKEVEVLSIVVNKQAVRPNAL